MEKEFIEYSSEAIRKPCSNSLICHSLTQYAGNYIKENRSKVSNIDKNVRDIVLTDAINYLGIYSGCNFLLYTKDLYKEEIPKKIIDTQVLLTTIQKFYATYIFEYNCTEKIDVNSGAIVLIDFINYIAEVNKYDMKFTIEDLYKNYKIQKYKQDMSRLKEFLEKSSKYSEELFYGESIDNIFHTMASKYNLKKISEDGTYHYIDIVSQRVGHSEMHPLIKEKVEEEIYAMAYAYEKFDNKEQSQIEEINKKIIEMKKR